MKAVFLLLIMFALACSDKTLQPCLCKDATTKPDQVVPKRQYDFNKLRVDSQSSSSEEEPQDMFIPAAETGC